MSTRVTPVERVREEIDALFAAERPLGEIMEEVARLGVRLVMQVAIEAEVTEFLGRERYARGERQRAGSRNGHCPTTIKTTAGPVRLERPKLRGTDQQFASRLFGKGVSRTNALETLVIAGFVRGLSVRDIEATLADAVGSEAALSKSTVSRICQQIGVEFDAWRERDLSAVEIDYLFCDASHFRMHAGSRAEPILSAWGITTAGAPSSSGWRRPGLSRTMPGTTSSAISRPGPPAPGTPGALPRSGRRDQGAMSRRSIRQRASAVAPIAMPASRRIAAVGTPEPASSVPGSYW